MYTYVRYDMISLGEQLVNRDAYSRNTLEISVDKFISIIQ